MVTLLGFFFVLANIGLLVMFMPDLVGPVRSLCTLEAGEGMGTNRGAGPGMALLQLCLRTVYVPDDGQCRRKASEEDRYLKRPR